MAHKNSDMSCSQVQENLYDYITGRLEPAQRSIMAGHIMSCSACRAEHDEMKITLGLLDQIKPPKVSDGFSEKVMQNLEPKVMSFTKRPAYRYVMQGAAAAIVVLAVVSIVKLMPGSAPDSSTVRGGATTTILDESCRNTIELYNKGTATVDLKQKEILLQQALAVGCTDNKLQARIHNNLADCYEQGGLLDKALAGYTKALEFDPQIYTAHLGLGDIYKKRGETQLAIEQYKIALSVMENTPKKDALLMKQIDELKRELHSPMTQ